MRWNIAMRPGKRRELDKTRLVEEVPCPQGPGKYFLTGSKAGILPAHAGKLARQMAQLNQASAPRDMNVPGWKLHELHDDMAGHRSVWVNGNWRLTFRFENGDAVLVNYQDYD